MPRRAAATARSLAVEAEVFLMVEISSGLTNIDRADKGEGSGKDYSPECYVRIKFGRLRVIIELKISDILVSNLVAVELPRNSSSMEQCSLRF